MKNTNYLTRDEAIARCEKAQPNRFLYGMFAYSAFDQETVFKCRLCGYRFLATPEAIWRKYQSKCPKSSCEKG